MFVDIDNLLIINKFLTRPIIKKSPIRLRQLADGGGDFFVSKFIFDFLFLPARLAIAPARFAEQSEASEAGRQAGLTFYLSKQFFC